VFDQDFWEEKYKHNIGWDLGRVSMPLSEYFDQLHNKALKILIPGCGNAYEAEYLIKLGFQNVYVLDIATTVLESFKKRFTYFPETHFFNENFFEHKHKYDLIIEQTFFCALDPSLRKNYVETIHSLLNPGGKLAGVMFGSEINPRDTNPPFGGSKQEYQELFSDKFTIKLMEECYNSIEKRAGRELFVILEKN